MFFPCSTNVSQISIRFQGTIILLGFLVPLDICLIEYYIVSALLYVFSFINYCDFSHHVPYEVAWITPKQRTILTVTHGSLYLLLDYLLLLCYFVCVSFALFSFILTMWLWYTLHVCVTHMASKEALTDIVAEKLGSQFLTRRDPYSF